MFQGDFENIFQTKYGNDRLNNIEDSLVSYMELN